MSLFSPSERTFVEAISALSYVNPFTPERVQLEQKALGKDFKPAFAVWSADADVAANNPNLQALETRARQLTETACARVAEGEGTREERALYRDLARFALYADYGQRLFDERIVASAQGPVAWWDDYQRDYVALVDVTGTRSTARDRGELLALFFQLRRAFHYIFSLILGGSTPTARLRAEVWHSIFTHDMRRYRRALAGRMNRVPTLILGPSGTGKELIARAIGHSLFVPWSATNKAFKDEVALFAPVNLSALSATLIESELFGHKRGAFTGAVVDKAGWMESCGDGGAVFLDEIGEIEHAVQVKLLRVLETRTFNRIGETLERSFAGKIIAATNRALDEAITEGRFRADLYYRLCADVITAPTLAERVASDPSELETLVGFLARRLVGEEEALGATDEVMIVLKGGTLRTHRWPGNVRELEQAVRNILIRGAYAPARTGGTEDLGGDALTAALDAGELSADELVRHYCTRVYLKTGSYEQTARLLKLDRRTVKSRVDPELLKQLSNDQGPA